MNARNKTQFTYAKNLILTIFALNASSNSTKVFKCPHTRNDSIFTHNGLQFKALKSNATLTLTKMNIMHDFTNRFAHIFQSTLASANSRSQKSF
ncbi:hypothetical protein H5410_060571 [Solanum commersonii]|uniref:Uncharacterized protein n=1 Tax=Solanum commersonii TaxID=4109 RepID=A0A9J5W5F5_SOLCO|nr:hypothetical protein H5410_060571 [Solanum commersonii]